MVRKGRIKLKFKVIMIKGMKQDLGTLEQHGDKGEDQGQGHTDTDSNKTRAQ